MDIVYSTDSRTDYFTYEKRVGAVRTRRCIDGVVTGCGKCVGYCSFDGHPGYLTEEHRRKHNCLGKGCFYYFEKPKVKYTH